jgi:hypothetical protein
VTDCQWCHKPVNTQAALKYAGICWACIDRLDRTAVNLGRMRAPRSYVQALHDYRAVQFIERVVLECIPQ